MGNVSSVTAGQGSRALHQQQEEPTSDSTFSRAIRSHTFFAAEGQRLWAARKLSASAKCRADETARRDRYDVSGALHDARPRRLLYFCRGVAIDDFASHRRRGHHSAHR